MKINKNIKYVSTFLGFTPPPGNGRTDEVMKTISDAVTGTGFGIRRRGRNPDRFQFVQHEQADRVKFLHADIRQDLPLHHATTIAVYLKRYSVGKWDNKLMCHQSKQGFTVVDVLQRIARALTSFHGDKGLITGDNLHHIITEIAGG